MDGDDEGDLPRLVIGGGRAHGSIMQAATGNPEDLRRLFHQEIDRMEPSRLEMLNRILQQLRIFELADQVDKGFDSDRAAGRFSAAQVVEAVRAVREDHPYA